MRQKLGDIEKAVVIFDDTGEEQTLTVKSDSAHHFFNHFMVGEVKIQFRLDWSEQDNNGRPMLDADFIDGKTGKHRKLKGERRNAHHTPSLPGDGRSYLWEFKEFSRKFNVVITWCASLTECAHASDSCDAELIKGA